MKIPKEGEWSFNSESVAKGFDNHVNEQLPWYTLATSIVEHIARHYLPYDGVLYDIGSSTGNITKSLDSIIKHRRIKAISLDASKEMCDLFDGVGEIINTKAEVYDYENFDCAVMFLTLMFVDAKKRQCLLDKLYEKLNTGGCIIVFDKILPDGGYLSIVNSRLALSEKLKNGSTHNEILDKELSLSGVQRPISKDIYGSHNIVFKYGDFIGFVIEK